MVFQSEINTHILKLVVGMIRVTSMFISFNLGWYGTYPLLDFHMMKTYFLTELACMSVTARSPLLMYVHL